MQHFTSGSSFQRLARFSCAERALRVYRVSLRLRLHRDQEEWRRSRPVGKKVRAQVHGPEVPIRRSERLPHPAQIRMAISGHGDLSESGRCHTGQQTFGKDYALLRIVSKSTVAGQVTCASMLVCIHARAHPCACGAFDCFL